jgi:23S rRNA (guanine745-N1)-methyltransferase
MSIDSTWLRCPNCSSDHEPITEQVFGCENGHRFDRAKHGYLTHLPPKAPRTVGDDRSMLTARAELLDGGAFGPISDALIRAVSFIAAGRRPDGRRDGPRVADLGCGTGYYSARLGAAAPDARLLLADRSPDAVRMALRAVPGATGVVLDIWRPLPLRAGSADVILNVFAPRNAAEFARILRPDGRLVVVVPSARHLEELRAERMLLDIPAEKAAAVADQLGVVGFRPSNTHRIEYELQADAEVRSLLAGMGPSAHHATTLESADDTSEGVRAVTVSVDVITFTRATS